MDTERKLEVLGQAARFDVCMSSCVAGGRKRDPLDKFKRWLYPASLPDGRVTHVLKILMSGECINNCAYCANRAGAGRDMSFTPDELAKAFYLMNRAGLAQGLFLSSAIATSPADQMGKMVATCEILRSKYRFRGYIHLKVLPGAPLTLLEAGAQYADRMSINFEATDDAALRSLAPSKNLDKDIRKRAQFIARLARNPRLRLHSHTTQFIVGATDETDAQFLKTAEDLIKEESMSRIYFSAFNPVKGTPLEDAPPAPLIREVRLYQAEFLLRQYGFSTEELTLDAEGNLNKDTDVKYATALAHPEWFPVDVNTATRRQLLRVPGIGPRTASRIIKVRSAARLKGISDLRKMGAFVRRAAPFLLISGKRAGTGLLPFKMKAVSRWPILTAEAAEQAQRTAEGKQKQKI